MKEDVRGTFKSEDQGPNCLQDTKSSNALVIIISIQLAIFTGLALLFQEFTDNAKICVAKLLAQRNGERSELCGEDLYKIFHDIGQLINIYFVGQLEELLHNGWNALLHAGTDNIVSDERLQGQGSSNTNREGRIRHAIQNVSIDSQEIVLILEVELLKFLNCVTCSGTEIALTACEVREDVADEEVLNLIGDGTFLAQNNRRKGCNHTQSAFLGHMVLLVIRRLFVFIDNCIDEFEDLKRLLPAVFSQVHEEIGSSHVRSRGFLKIVKFAVQIFLGLVIELFGIFLSKTHDGEDEMSNEVGKMSLQVSPHLFGANGFVQEHNNVRKARSTEPGCLGHPFFDFLEIVFEDFGGNSADEILSKLCSLVSLSRAGGVSVSVVKVSN